MICGSNEKEKIYGVISWGLDCAKGVGIYTRVAFHRQWIDKEINATRFQKKGTDYSYKDTDP